MLNSLFKLLQGLALVILSGIVVAVIFYSSYIIIFIIVITALAGIAYLFLNFQEWVDNNRD